MIEAAWGLIVVAGIAGSLSAICWAVDTYDRWRAGATERLWRRQMEALTSTEQDGPIDPMLRNRRER